MGNLSGFLFASPSVLEGVARIFDFGNTLSEYNYSPSGEEADALAIKADWLAVGDDLRAAMTQFDQEHKLPVR